MAGCGPVWLPGTLSRKYPNTAAEWTWQWAFPATQRRRNKRTGVRHRHHLYESVVSRALREAVATAGLVKKAATHTFRHSFATHLLEGRADIRTVHELPGHRDVRTRMVYTHVLNRSPAGSGARWTTSVVRPSGVGGPEALRPAWVAGRRAVGGVAR